MKLCDLEQKVPKRRQHAAELALQFKFGELCDPWEETEDHISPEELGIDSNEVVGFKGTIEGLKSFF